MNEVGRNTTKFENVGIIELAPSGKSLKITLNDLPFTTFKHVAYVSVKGVEDVLRKHKRNVTIVMIKGIGK
jgi:hypothetical protein